jgi:predicted site-specific integrase-resolvase
VSHKAALRLWDEQGLIKTIRTPGGMRLFDISSIDKSSTENTTQTSNQKNTKRIMLYSRVSSSKQREDLQRQKSFLQTNIPDKLSRFDVQNISDIGSGINFKRPGLLRVLELVKSGELQAIVVASRDRLARFGFELIEWLCQQYGAEIVVLDSDNTGSGESELGKDLMAIVQVYCCRWNGQRRYKNKSSSIEVETKT